MVPPELISIFDAQELELLISGLPDIDLDDLRAHTDYHSYKPTDPEITWFVNIYNIAILKYLSDHTINLIFFNVIFISLGFGMF